ncbi:hypothetical protein [Phyllobacterium phragmitis]|uniref:hypothetical protein n=1 Tax=Phyllobacterium phragmitis TaxID=2670329 RepID=UPI0011B2405E|nr:hypothetical protein [Phyllobacterium phragmitis]
MPSQKSEGNFFLLIFLCVDGLQKQAIAVTVYAELENSLLVVCATMAGARDRERKNVVLLFSNQSAPERRIFYALSPGRGRTRFQQAKIFRLLPMRPGGHGECPGRKPKGHVAVQHGFQLPASAPPAGMMP